MSNTSPGRLLHYFPDLTELQQQQFAQLYDLYIYWNSRINVISRKDIEELYIHHVLHSLAIARFISFNPGANILDIGTGGGLPGIPLAIFFPESTFLLADSIAKKIKVVNEVVSAAGLNNVMTHTGRVEAVKGKFDFIVSRAVADLSLLVSWTRKLLSKERTHAIAPGWICLKGGDLVEEASKTGRPFQIIPIQRWFSEPFFETKRIVYVES